MVTQFIRNCSNCNKTLIYTNKKSYNRAKNNQSQCIVCSNKKKYSDDIIKNIILLYNNNSISKISKDLKIKKNNVKEILINNGVFIENRDSVIDSFTKNQIKDIINKYTIQNISLKKIGEEYNVSRTPIKRILIENNVKLKSTNSNGKKINLTINEQNLIKNLYLNENKTTLEIAQSLNLNKSFVDKFLSQTDYRRNKSQSITMRQLGKKRSEETIAKLKLAQQKLSNSGKRKQTGGVCNWFKINELSCQGTYEKFYIEKLLNENSKIPKNSKSIKTPFGYYYADFEFENKYIEIKSDYTYNILIGLVPNRWTKKFDTKQYQKIKWVHNNIKEVEILIVDKINNKLTKKEIN